MRAPTNLVCPVCLMEWPTEPLDCLCGYSFEQRDPTRALASIRRRLRRADRMIAGGVLAIASVPVGAVLGAPAIALLFLFPIQVVFGTACTLAGVRGRLHERTQLRAALRLRQLPAARIVR